MENIIILILAASTITVGVYSYWRSRRFKLNLEKREKEIKRKMYELAILKELGERIGYSLNVENIIDIISGSLHQFISYSVVSYMFIEPEKIIFKAHLEKSVSKNFFIDIKQRMLSSLSALLEKDFTKARIEEILSGAILAENLEEPVRSFFNIPLVIANKVVGILTIADTEAGRYKEEEMTILYKIVGQASQAVTRLGEVVASEQRKMNAMVESITEGVIMTDKDYRIMVANPAARKSVGVEKISDISIFDFIDKLEGKFNIKEKLEESVKLNKVSIMDDILLKDHFYQITTLPVKSNTGINEDEILGGVVIFHDITKEKEIEKLREDFTSMIAHELRSPLNQIKMLSETLQEDKLKKKERQNYCQMIYGDSSSLIDLVTNLLDMAKLEAGKFKILKQPSDITRVIKDRINFFKPSMLKKKINIKTFLASNIPSEINFDPLRISQILNNLLSNALKFTKEGGEISVQGIIHKKGENFSKEMEKEKIEWFIKDNAKTITKLPDSLIVAVTDTGLGISRNNIKLLFKRFQQIENQEGKGTGLGLLIIKGITEAHGGIVGVESKEKNGSTFYFSLPIN